MTSERILFWIAFAGFVVALVGVGVAFAVSNHPDRATAAKLFFSLASLVFAVGMFYWTISTGWGLAIRAVADLLSSSLIAAGLLGGFRFADRGLLTELGLPSSAFVREPLWPQNKNFAALIIVTILAVTALMNGWREPDPGRWVWPLFVFVYDLRWFLLAFGINALALAIIYGLSVRQQKRFACPEPLLHDLAKQDAIRIKDLVRVTGIHYRPEFAKGSPYIDFVFGFFNISLFDVVVDNSIKKGSILFGEDNEKFYYPPRVEGENIGCRSRSGNYFVVRQAVTAEEITRFRKAKNLLLAFHSLEIMFHGTEQFSEIGPTPLNTHHYLETEKRIWRASDEGETVFTFTDEQWDLLSSSNKQEVAILRAEIDSLKGQLNEHTGDEPKRLRAIAERDSANLSSTILIHELKIQFELTKSVPYINFRFALFNGSVYEVSVLDSLGGYIKFRKERLMGQREIARNDATKMGHASTGRFWVRYQLSREEADLIANAHAPNMDYFYFDKLEILIMADGMEPQLLTLPHAIPSNNESDAGATLRE